MKNRTGNGRFLAALIGLAAFLLVPATANAGNERDLDGVQLAGGGSDWKLLVSMNLPLEISGSKVSGNLTVSLPNRGWSGHWEARVHAGSLRLADQRTRFRFVAGVRIPADLGRSLARSGTRARANTKVSYRMPTADPTAETNSGSGVVQKRVIRAAPGSCETLPRLLLETPGVESLSVRTPACGRQLVWKLTGGPGLGRATVSGKKLTYSRGAGKSGSDEFELAGYFRGRLVTSQKVQIRAGNLTGSNVSVAALGDSVTAGFGYFGATGKQMGLTQLINCRPGATVFNDACSSNSSNRNSSIGTKPDYLPDFGLSRNISWAAQWANQYGITDYENYAVTGSAPSDWLPGGQFADTRAAIEKQNPDYILLTMGANPLLSDVLFGVDNMGCALESDLFGDFRQCVLDAFEAVKLDDNLNALYSSLVENSTSQIVVMQYHLTVPSTALAYSATQLEAMTELMNEVIADEAGQVSTSRITVVTPPRFDVGIDMTPLYPSGYSCSFLGYKVDGPSVQATVSQDELLVDHPLSFCSGPAIGAPWIISGDTGIHPSAAGYLEMASQVPAPGS